VFAAAAGITERIPLKQLRNNVRSRNPLKVLTNLTSPPRDNVPAETKRYFRNLQSGAR